MGDSATSFVAGHDTDRRPLFEMIADEISPEVRLTTVHGGSYTPPLYDAFLRLLDPAHMPRVIILPLCARVRTTPWVEHPTYGHKNAIEFLRHVDPAARLRQIRRGFPRPTGEDFADFYQLPHPTWAGDWTIGDYVNRLKGARQDDDWVRLLYAYHHGGVVTPGPALDAVTALGERLRSLNTAVVVYETPIPVEKGAEMHGPEFRDLAECNLELLGAALRKGYGPIEVVRTGLEFTTAEFIDWRDGSEHLNQRGRLHLAERVGAALRTALDPRVHGGIRG